VEPVRRGTGHIHDLPGNHGVGAVAHGVAERRHDRQLARSSEGLAREPLAG